VKTLNDFDDNKKEENDDFSCCSAIVKNLIWR